MVTVYCLYNNKFMTNFLIINQLLVNQNSQTKDLDHHINLIGRFDSI